MDEKTPVETVNSFARLSDGARNEVIAMLQRDLKTFMDMAAQSDAKPAPEPKVDDAVEVAWREHLVAMLQDAELLEKSAELIEKTPSVDSARMVGLMRDYVELTRWIAKHFANCPSARAEFEVEWRNAQVQESVPG